MQNLKNWNTLVIMILVFLITVSCSSEEKTTDLSIAVLDADQNQVQGAMVTLYANRTDWEQDIRSVGSQMTAANGAVTFIDLASRSYYLDIRKDRLTNWSTMITSPTLTLEELTSMTVNINTTVADLLVGKKEHSYQMTDLRLQGVSLLEEVDLCERDNVHFFQRDEQLGAIDLGQDLCPGENGGDELFQWNINTDESELQLEFESGESSTYRIISIDEQKFVVETSVPIGGPQMELVDVVFTKL